MLRGNMIRFGYCAVNDAWGKVAFDRRVACFYAQKLHEDHHQDYRPKQLERTDGRRRQKIPDLGGQL